MARSITIQAWIDGGPSTPNATVTLARSDEHPGLYELSVRHDDGETKLTGVLIDAGSVEVLTSVVPEPGTEHVVEANGPDSAGHFGWDCKTCPENRSGYELIVEVITTANEHGRLTYDSYRMLQAGGDPVTAR